MQAPDIHLFGAWESFYVIVGSSAAALTGLQFVVVTLVTEAWRAPRTRELGAFATPTIVHFCTALLVSATLSAPWPTPSGPRWVIDVAGSVGMVYAIWITWRATHNTRYRMVLEDWLWHIVFPILAYLILVVAAATLDAHFDGSLFWIAGATLLLLDIGIHNAWDTTTYIATGRAQADEAKRQEEEGDKK
jgi:hypothetical protein